MTVAGIVTDVNSVQLRNASLGICVMLAGMVTDLTAAEFFSNAARISLTV